MTKERHFEVYEYVRFGTKNGEQIINDLQESARELAIHIVDASKMLEPNECSEKLEASVSVYEIAQSLFTEVLIKLTETYAATKS